jgi:site-specific DNA recombinase
MRAVIYCRVSSDRQVQNLSLETQEDICRDYCRRNGLEVARVFVDAGESAKTADRAEFLALLKFCRQKSNNVHLVVFYSINRFARNTTDHHAIAALLRGSGVMVRSATEPIDDTPTGKLMETFLAGIAQFENDVKSARSKEGMKAALARGRWCWVPPLGYRRGDRRNKSAPSIEPDPPAAPLIAQAFDWVARGVYTGRALNDKLRGLGLVGRHGAPLALSRLYAILHNPVYTGRIEGRGWGTSQQGDFEPLVSAETFARAQQQLALARAGQASPTRHKNNPEFPLRRFVRCAVCANPLTASRSKGRTTRYAFYHCRRGCIRVRREKLEAAFLVLLDSLRPRDSYLRFLRATVLDLWEETQRAEESQARALQLRETKLKEQMRHLDRLFIFEQRIDDASYRQQRDELRESLTLTQIDLRAAAAAEADIESMLAFAEHALVNASRIWTAAPDDRGPHARAADVLPSRARLGARRVCRTGDVLRYVRLSAECRW